LPKKHGKGLNKQRIISSYLPHLKNRANKAVCLDNNQTPVVSNSCISGRNEKAGAIVIIKNMFRLITCGSGTVKEYFFVKQDPAYRPVASNRHIDGTTAELPVTTCRSAGWDVAMCRAKMLVAFCQ
jgi:hypothetical protein